jgi:hypothetical protein
MPLVSRRLEERATACRLLRTRTVAQKAMTKCDVLGRPFAPRYLTLHYHRAGDGIDHAGELDQHFVAGRLDDPAII